MHRALSRAAVITRRIVSGRQVTFRLKADGLLSPVQRRLFSAKRRRGVKLGEEVLERSQGAGDADTAVQEGSSHALETSSPSLSTPAVETIDVQSPTSGGAGSTGGTPTSPPSSFSVLTPALVLLLGGGLAYYLSTNDGAREQLLDGVAGLPVPVQQGLKAIGIVPPRKPASSNGVRS